MVTEYPAGLILLCLLLGAGYAAVLYYREIRKKQRPFLLYGMAGFRFLSVSLIAFLLLAPMIRQSHKEVEKPVVIIGVDNSRSLVLAGDSDFCRNTLPGQVKQLAEALEKKCEVVVYSFDDRLTPGFSGGFDGTRTDISLFFNEIGTRYANRNAAAVVLASDGLYNEGSDPFYAARNIPFPVYTIALGDTGLKKDVAIRKVIVNKTVYKGDRFPVEVLVDMTKCSGQKTRLSLSGGARFIEAREARAGSDRAMQKLTFFLDAAGVGMVRYSLHLDEMEGEVSLENNHADFLVEVLEARQKIALVSSSPHPDVTAIAKALEGSTHFELEIIPPGEMPASFEKSDLVILHQVPSVANVTDLGPLMKSGTSILFILGTRSDLNSFNNLKTGLVINSARNSFSESQPVFNPGFSLFTMESADLEAFGDAPPLQAPFGTYQASPLAEVLFYQKIGNVSTKTPLVLFSLTPERKTGIIAGENLWRWRIAGYVRQSNHERFDGWIDKIAQYLSVREDKSFFRVRVNSRLSENEPVEFEAELYNASYELINQPEVNITITDSEGKNYPFTFSKSLKAYFLNAGRFPVGEYTYRASARTGNNSYQKTGKFFIEKVNLESAHLVADHNLLFRLANAHDGEMVNGNNMTALAGKILARPDIRPVAFYQKRLSDLIGNPWLFALIIALLTAEWVVRKREGL